MMNKLYEKELRKSVPVILCVCVCFIYLFYYYFLAALGLSCGMWGLRCGTWALCFGAWASLQLWRTGSRVRGLCSCGVRGPECVGSVVCGMQALYLRHASSVVVVRRLMPCSMWDLSSLTRDQTCLPCIGRQILYHWTTREVPVCFNNDYFFLFAISYLDSEPECLLNQRKKNSQQFVVMDQGIGEVVEKFLSISQTT